MKTDRPPRSASSFSPRLIPLFLAGIMLALTCTACSSLNQDSTGKTESKKVYAKWQTFQLQSPDGKFNREPEKIRLLETSIAQVLYRFLRIHGCGKTIFHLEKTPLKYGPDQLSYLASGTLKINPAGSDDFPAPRASDLKEAKSGGEQVIATPPGTFSGQLRGILVYQDLKGVYWYQEVSPEGLRMEMQEQKLLKK